MSDKPRVMPLQETVKYLQSHHHQAILHYDADPERGIGLWTPALKTGVVPISLRRAIVKHKDGLKALMDSGAVELCTNHHLHRQSWQYHGNGRFVCELCRNFVAAGVC